VRKASKSNFELVSLVLFGGTTDCGRTLEEQECVSVLEEKLLVSLIFFKLIEFIFIAVLVLQKNGVQRFPAYFISLP
jgi:hypothetical protein